MMFIIIFFLFISIFAFPYIYPNNSFGNEYYELKMKNDNDQKFSKTRINSLVLPLDNFVINSPFENEGYYPVSLDEEGNIVIINYTLNGIEFYRFSSNALSTNKLSFSSNRNVSEVKKDLINLKNHFVHFIKFPFIVGSFYDNKNDTPSFFIAKLKIKSEKFILDEYKVIDFGSRIDNLYFILFRGFFPLSNHNFIILGNLLDEKVSANFYPYLDILISKLDESMKITNVNILKNIAGGNQQDSISKSIVDNEGNIYMGGASKSLNHCTDILLVKLNNQGDFDKNFGNNGILLINGVGNGVDSISDMEIFQDYLICGGITYDKNSIGRAFVMKLSKKTGDFDPTFGNYGEKIINSNYNSQVVKLEVGNNIFAQVCEFKNSSNPIRDYYNLKIIEINQEGKIVQEMHMNFTEPTHLLDIIYRDGKLYLITIQKSNQNYNRYFYRIFRFYTSDNYKG